MRALVLIFLMLVPFPYGAYGLEPDNKDAVEEIINVFARGKKAEIATLFKYPISMKYPNPDIITREEFIERFDEVIDQKLLGLVAASTPDKDWDEVGWRGIMFDGGLIWVGYEGEITKINYTTKKQKLKVERLISRQKETIHQSLKRFRRPVLEWDIGQYLIRIDQMEDSSYRYSSWRKNKQTHQKPDIILINGTLTRRGTGGNHYYDFKNGNYLYRVSILRVGPNDIPPGRLEVFKDNELLFSEDLSVRNNS